MKTIQYPVCFISAESQNETARTKAVVKTLQLFFRYELNYESEYHPNFPLNMVKMESFLLILRMYLAFNFGRGGTWHTHHISCEFQAFQIFSLNASNKGLHSAMHRAFRDPSCTDAHVLRKPMAYAEQVVGACCTVKHVTASFTSCIHLIQIYFKRCQSTPKNASHLIPDC